MTSDCHVRISALQSKNLDTNFVPHHKHHAKQKTDCKPDKPWCWTKEIGFYKILINADNPNK